MRNFGIANYSIFRLQPFRLVRRAAIKDRRKTATQLSGQYFIGPDALLEHAGELFPVPGVYADGDRAVVYQGNLHIGPEFAGCDGAGDGR